MDAGGWLWRIAARFRYGHSLAKTRATSPERRLSTLDQWEGLWVAVKDGVVIAAAHNSGDLVPELRKLGLKGVRRSCPVRNTPVRDNHDRCRLSPAVKFPYREEGNPTVLRPTLDIQLRYGPNGEWTTRALIHTGSPITVFDRGAADALGVKIYQTCAETGTIALLGGERMVQFDYIDLTLVMHPEVTWIAHVAFVRDPSFQMAFQGILGTTGFLDKWAVKFSRVLRLLRRDSS